MLNREQEGAVEPDLDRLLALHRRAESDHEARCPHGWTSPPAAWDKGLHLDCSSSAGSRACANPLSRDCRERNREPNTIVKKSIPRNTICLWYNKEALDAARFYAATFPDSKVAAVHHAPGDYPSGKEGDILTVEFTVLGIPCLGLNGGPAFRPTEAFSYQVATDTQEETDRYWNAIVGSGGQASACGWCKDRWGVSWQITPRVLIEALAAGGAEAKRAFAAMMEMGKIDISKIEAARRGR